MASSNDFIHTVEHHSLDLWYALQAQVQILPQALCLTSGLAAADSNKAILRCNAKPNPAIIDELSEKFKKKNLPFSWLIPQIKESQGVCQALKNHGLYPHAPLTSMAIALDGHYELSTNAHICIEKVATLETLLQAGQLIQESYAMTDSAIFAYFKRHVAHFLVPEARYDYYVAYIDDEIVGCGSVLFGKKFAGIYNIGTKTSARKQGVATKILLTLLQQAQEKEYRHVILTALPAAETLYKKIGFEELVRYNVYVSTD